MRCLPDLLCPGSEIWEWPVEKGAGLSTCVNGLGEEALLMLSCLWCFVLIWLLPVWDCREKTSGSHSHTQIEAGDAGAI